MELSLFYSGFWLIRDRRRIRTFDRLLRRQVLYPAELCDLNLLSNQLYRSNILDYVVSNQSPLFQGGRFSVISLSKLKLNGF